MSNAKSIRRRSSSNQSISSSTTSKKTIFPLPNATKPRYIVPKKLEINELPDVVLLHVFRYFSPLDLFNISTVCRRWYSIAQDECLWRSLVLSYGLHQTSSTLTSKQKVQGYLNQQIKSQLKALFPNKFDPLKSYTGIPDYQKMFNKSSEQLHFLLAFCDDKHNILWSQRCDTTKYFDISLSIRWLEITMPDLLPRVHFLRLFSIISIEIKTQPNRLRLPKANEQLANVTEKPVRHVQKIQSLLREYPFSWSALKSKSQSFASDIKSPVYILDETDYLLALYTQDRSFAFLVFNINYLSFHELFFAGLRSTNASHSQSLSQMILPKHLLKVNDLEASVFVCFRNSTSTFFRHRFPNCRLKYSSSPIIELIRTTDMTEELGPELEELPKFNWKTHLFKGTLGNLFLLDIVVINERKDVSFSLTLPATLMAAGDDQQGSDFILSANVWQIQARSQCNTRLQINGTIMRLEKEYCALGRDSQSWHLQNLTFSF